MLVCLRWPAFLGLVVSFLTIGALTRCFFFIPRPALNVFLCWISLCWARLLLKILALKTEIRWHCRKPAKDENFLIAFNHLSYLDAVIIASIMPTRFVTSVEVKETPFLGWLAKGAGALYVERRDRANIKNEVQDISDALHRGENVSFAPEATSTNGEQLLPFKRSIFVAAIQSGKKVLPICINYRKINGEPVTRSNRDALFWYADMSFFPHFNELLSLSFVLATIEILEAIPAGKDHRQLAARTFDSINACYEPVTSE